MFKKLNQEFKDSLLKMLEAEEAKATMQKAEGEDNGRFKVIISTDEQDRHGEVVKINAWELDRYMQNPVVLWGHKQSELPIGRADKVYIEGNKLIAEGYFASAEANPMAQQVRKLYDAGILKTTSVGFIAHEWDGNTITKAELLEFSFVSVPANPGALDLAKSLDVDMEMVHEKGIIIKETEQTPEDGPETPQEEPQEDAGDEETAETVEDTPEVETEEPEAEEKAKGAVQDEIDADKEQRRRDYDYKWDKFSKVDEIVSAFWHVYFKEDTAVDDFNMLLSEAINLLISLGTSEAEATKTIGSLINAKAFTDLELNLIKEATTEEVVEETPAAEEPETTNEPTESEEEVDTPDSEPEDEDGDSTTEDGDVAEAKSLYQLRKILKQADNALGETLAGFNQSLTK